MESLNLFTDLIGKVAMIAVFVFLLFYLVACGVDLYKYLKGNYPEPQKRHFEKEEDDNDLGIFMQ